MSDENNGAESVPDEWRKNKDNIAKNKLDSSEPLIVSEDQAKLVGDDRVVPRVRISYSCNNKAFVLVSFNPPPPPQEWRRASLPTEIEGKQVDVEVAGTTPPSNPDPIEWKNHKENIGKRVDSFSSGVVDEDQAKLVKDHRVVPKEWRRASMTPTAAEGSEGKFEPQRKDSTPQEWRRASVQALPASEHDNLGRRPSHIFQREEEKVKKKIGLESVPDSWVGNTQVRTMCRSLRLTRELAYTPASCLTRVLVFSPSPNHSR